MYTYHQASLDLLLLSMQPPDTKAEGMVQLVLQTSYKNGIRYKAASVSHTACYIKISFYKPIKNKPVLLWFQK